MKTKWITLYLDIADRLAQESHAVRLKVGAVFVSPDGVMSTGINGLPSGGSNVCESEIVEYDEHCVKLHKLKTLDEVSHAEENCYSKMLQNGISAKGGTLFITHRPCSGCSRLILNSGTSTVYYKHDYGNSAGVDFLVSNGVKVEKSGF